MKEVEQACGSCDWMGFLRGEDTHTHDKEAYRVCHAAGEEDADGVFMVKKSMPCDKGMWRQKLELS